MKGEGLLSWRDANGPEVPVMRCVSGCLTGCARIVEKVGCDRNVGSRGTKHGSRIGAVSSDYRGRIFTRLKRWLLLSVSLHGILAFWDQYVFLICGEREAKGPSIVVSRFEDHGTTYLGKERSNKRAWITQEWILSPRLVHLMKSGLIWCCKKFEQAKDLSSSLI